MQLSSALSVTALFRATLNHESFFTLNKYARSDSNRSVNLYDSGLVQ